MPVRPGNEPEPPELQKPERRRDLAAMELDSHYFFSAFRSLFDVFQAFYRCFKRFPRGFSSDFKLWQESHSDECDVAHVQRRSAQLFAPQGKYYQADIECV